MSTAKFNE